MKHIIYINENIELACELTGLAADEIESIVGRFAAHSRHAGLLRGKLVEFHGQLEIRTSFGSKKLWKLEQI